MLGHSLDPHIFARCLEASFDRLHLSQQCCAARNHQICNGSVKPRTAQSARIPCFCSFCSTTAPRAVARRPKRCCAVRHDLTAVRFSCPGSHTAPGTMPQKLSIRHRTHRGGRWEAPRPPLPPCGPSNSHRSLRDPPPPPLPSHSASEASSPCSRSSRETIFSSSYALWCAAGGGWRPARAASRCMACGRHQKPLLKPRSSPI